MAFLRALKGSQEAACTPVRRIWILTWFHHSLAGTSFSILLSLSLFGCKMGLITLLVKMKCSNIYRVSSRSLINSGFNKRGRERTKRSQVFWVPNLQPRGARGKLSPCSLRGLMGRSEKWLWPIRLLVFQGGQAVVEPRHQTSRFL